MRCLIIAAAAVAALGATVSLAGTTAQAMPLSGLSNQSESSAVPVYLKCRTWYDSYGYPHQKCWEVSDYYAPQGYGYAPPPPVYRPRYYGAY